MRARMWFLFIPAMFVVAWVCGGPWAGEAPLCSACGQPITGPVFETQGKYYHPEHFTCAYCGDPIEGAYTTYRGKNYHDACFKEHVALRCEFCGGVISGPYILDYWGNAYHKEHEKDAITCDFCGRLVTEDLLRGGKRYRDGRFLCRLCYATVVQTPQEADTVMREVAAKLKAIAIDVPVREIDLHLIGRKELQKFSKNHASGLTGFADYQEARNIFGRARARRIDVYLLYGMPRAEVVGTLAHELTHVWQFTHGRLKNDHALSEGSCNYAALIVLRKTGGNEGEFIIQKMLDDPDPVYGEGLRRVKRYAETHGIRAWLELLKENGPLPN